MGGNIGQGCGFTNRDKRKKLRELRRQRSSPGYSEVALGEKSIITSVSVDMAWNKPEPLPY
jgi:hypothetical protein